MDINKIKAAYDHPLAVHFGKSLPWHFVCASDEQLESVLGKNYLGYESFAQTLRNYGLLAKGQ